MLLPLPEEPPLKKFKSKHDLPKLNTYEGTAPDWYWKSWPHLSWEEGKKMKSQIDPEILLRLGTLTKFPYPCLLKEICQDLKKGASLGVSKDHQIPSRATNAPSAMDDGDKVSDKLAAWIAKGYVVGPLNKEDIPFKEVKSLV